MADMAAILPGNVDGNFYVDDTCIDCDLCRQIAPYSFAEMGGQSVVSFQPRSKEHLAAAKKALVACPTGSIGTRRKIELASAVASFPESIEDGVYFCGFASRRSFGAKSYLIVRPEGNVLVDSPRFSSSLVGRIDELGGVRTMFLTHIDDVADHERFRRRFGCERIIHRDEGMSVGAERLIDGFDPVSIHPDLVAVPTPGHTRGHTVLLYKNRFLFTGDHLAWSDQYGQLIAFRRHNWYSWTETIRSMERLAAYPFEWVLPGHGRSAHLPAAEMSARLTQCVEWMKQVA